MAAAFGSFSIREYALKMRTFDVVKSWPFGGKSDEVQKEAAEGFLPPITVTKFRWWSDEVELLRSNRDESDLEMTIDGNKIASEKVEAENSNAPEEEKEKLEKVCPVCRVFAASTVNAVNAHIDGCLALASTEEQWQMKKASPKTKSRVPKKRSIAEIFAVAPPIEAIPIAKYERDEHINGNGLKHGETNKSKVSKSRDSVSAIETIKDMKKTKKKMKKDRTLLETSAPIANRSNKPKKNFNNGKVDNIITTKEMGNRVHLHDDYYKTQRHLSSNRRHTRGDLNHVSVRRKEIAIQGSLTQREHKLVLNSRKKMCTPPCISILKNKTKLTYELGSPNCGLQASDQETLHGKERPEKHVRFLDKEVILGSESFTDSKEKEKIIEGNKEVSPLEEGESDEVNADVQCMTGKKQLSDGRDRNKPPYMSKFLIEDQDYPTLSSENASSGTPGSVDVLEGQHKLCVETQGRCNVPRPFDSYRQLIDHLVDPQHPVEKTLVTSSSFSTPSPSSAFSENADKRFSTPTPSVAKPYASPVGMVASRGPFPDWLQSTVACNRNRVDEFFGLPLNSQGELIHLSSSGTNGFIHPEESRSIAASSSNVPLYNSFLTRNLSEYRTANERDLPKYHINLFPSPSNVEGTRRVETQWVNFENEVNQPVKPLPLDSNSSWMNISYDRCRYLGKVQSQNEYHEYPTQRTMRLMGKDVAVGRSNKPIQGLECGKFWRNCEYMTDYLPAYTNTNQFNPCSNRVFFPDHSAQAQLETPREALFHHLRFQNNHTFHGNLPTQQPSSYPFLINETNAPYRNCKAAYRDGNAADGLFKENPRLNVHLLSHSTSCSPIFSVTPNIQQRYASGVEPLTFGVQPVMSSSQNSSQEMYSSGRLNCKPNIIPSKSAFGFPFLHQDYVEHEQSPNFQVSKNLPPWMFQSKELENAPFSSSRICSGMNWNSYSHISPGNKILSTPSVRHFPRVPYSCNATPSNSYMKNAPASTSVFHPQFVPIIPGTKPIAALNTLNIKDSVSSKKTNKRPADKLVYPRKPPKITISKMQDFVAGKSEAGQKNWFELHSRQDAAADTVECLENKALIDGPNVDSMARVGPIKLSAGTKHILKPSQGMEQDNSKPIHSTIPYAEFSSHASLPESQKKTAKIYTL